MFYIEPCEYEPCVSCSYVEYDSFLNKLYCSHEPLPDGLGNRALVDKWGSCGYYEGYKYE